MEFVGSYRAPNSWDRATIYLLRGILTFNSILWTMGEECRSIPAWYGILAAQKSWVKCFQLQGLVCRQAISAPRLFFCEAMPYRERCWVFRWAQRTSQMVLFSFSLRDAVSTICILFTYGFFFAL